MAKFQVGDRAKSKTTKWEAVLREGGAGQLYWEVMIAPNGYPPAEGTTTEYLYYPENDEELEFVIENIDGRKVLSEGGSFYTAKLDKLLQQIRLSKPFEPEGDNVWAGNYGLTALKAKPTTFKGGM